MLPTWRHSWAYTATTSCPVLSIHTPVNNSRNNLWIEMSLIAGLPPTAQGSHEMLGNIHCHFARGNCKNTEQDCHGLTEQLQATSFQTAPESKIKQKWMITCLLLLSWSNEKTISWTTWNMALWILADAQVITLSVRLIRNGQGISEY